MFRLALTLSIIWSFAVPAQDSLAHRLASSLSEQDWFGTSAYETTVLDTISVRCSNCPNGFKAESIIQNGPDTLGRVYRWHVMGALCYAIELGNELKVFTERSKCIISAEIYGHRSVEPPSSMFDLNFKTIDHWYQQPTGEPFNFGHIVNGNGHLYLQHDQRLQLSSVSIRSGKWEGESITYAKLTPDEPWTKMRSRFYINDTVLPVRVAYQASFPQCTTSITCDSLEYCINDHGKVSEVFATSRNEQDASVNSHPYGWFRRLFNKRLDRLPLLDLIGVTCPEYHKMLKDNWITPPSPD